MKILAFAAIALALAGCVSSGTKVTQAQADSFIAGQTTKAQVIATLGPPNGQASTPDGTTILSYVHIASSANAASFIPVVGLLAGGATGTSQTATFTFDPSGVLKTHSTTQGANEVHTGLLNQKE